MTKEQEEVIERLNRFKTIKVLYGNTFAMNIQQLKTVQEDIEAGLNMIKEKDKEIKKKDEIIDLMVEEIKERKYVFTDKTKKYIKQCFERKSEE